MTIYKGLLQKSFKKILSTYFSNVHTHSFKYQFFFISFKIMSYKQPGKFTRRLLAFLLTFRFWCVIGIAETINGGSELGSMLKQKTQYELQVARHRRDLLPVRL